jgi:D-sedoheptulose 7-phosphate isomerase
MCVIVDVNSLEMQLMQKEFFNDYASRLAQVLESSDWTIVCQLANAMRRAWAEGRQVFFCGNGGSAGNAVHLANDFVYGVARTTGGGIRALSLSANSAVITCLANDVGYEKIYCEQLAVQGRAGDILVALSGSGNSPNIISAIERAKVMKIESYAVLGFSGGRCKELADFAIHFPVDDMQIAEDLQLVVGHMLMQWLSANRPGV